MSARRVSALVVEGESIAQLAEALRIAIALRTRSGLPVPPAWRELKDAATGCPSPDTAAGEPVWLGTTEAAQMLGKSDRQVRRLADQLGARRIGGRLAFPLDELTEWSETK